MVKNLDVCIITGGAGGMGFETAKLIGNNQKCILVGRNELKLKNAINQLKEIEIDAEYFIADICERESIKELIKFSKEIGNIKTLIHTAGVSPKMDTYERIFDINACGTIIINEEVLPEMKEGGVVLNVSSMASYFVSSENRPIHLYELAFKDLDSFKNEFKQMVKDESEVMKCPSAYKISKNFVNWYSEQMALKYGKNGIRVVSISPGTFSTPMCKIEGKNSEAYAKMGALGRVGDPKEIAKMMKFIVSDECSYLTGVDILYDGGTVAALNARKRNK
ncbi:NAD(P)-binding protein [Anaeromyces robustus]|uniref:NAD(P)-binding protein n=1 Tax=Anaeromyces robustus TaxID=1754192 RepID=A0A1Y1WTC1_9FUNG|nr:NAD(P)-binding protein [Anaeromyces robustus]|eukprot:ORX76773.1 NAD(P)-binding protein [Anaeromyces robustus]